MNKYYLLLFTTVSVMMIGIILFILRNDDGQNTAKSTLSAKQNRNSSDDSGTENKTGTSFESEKIQINIAEGRVSVTGHYYFHNHEPGKRMMPLSYPFPVNAEMEFPDSIDVHLIDNDSLSIPFEKDEEHGMVFFTVPVSGLTEFVVGYTQKLHGTTARYILTTTQAWKKPLKSAEFTVSVPHSFEKIRINYKPDLTQSEQDSIFYLIKRTDFMPAKDLVITWQTGCLE